jgi:putative sterol carrier protein
MVARFTSPEWIAELDRALMADPALRLASTGVSLVVQQTVTDGPEGDASWHVVVDDGTARVVPGDAPSADVTFRQTYETAAAINQGRLSAQTAFMTGRLRVGGDVELLMAHQATFDGVEDAFDAVRAGTEF